MPVDSVSPLSEARRWSAAKRIGFDVVFVYLVLYHIEAYLGLLNPVFRLLRSPIGPRALYRLPWDGVAKWIGVHLFSIDPAVLIPVNQSTDAAIHYARAACFLLTAVVVATVWRPDKRGEAHALHHWLYDFVRFAVAINLFYYGVNKLIPVQMLPGRLFATDLIQPFGRKSPAGLLWAFIGYSIPYQMFSGAAELLAALLLLSVRTTAFGALVSFAATLNVVLLNFSYDVDLKLYTANLFAASLFLAWPVFVTMWRMFVLRQSVSPPAIGAVGQPWTMTPARVVFAVLFGIYAYQTVAGAYSEYNLQVGLPEATPLYGIYDVEQFRRNGEDVPPLTTDHTRWRRVVMESPRVVRVQLMDDSFVRYRAEYNRATKQLTLFGTGATSIPSGPFVWSLPDADEVRLDGHIDNDAVVLTLKRIDPATFLLLNRGFHWIQRDSLIQ